MKFPECKLLDDYCDDDLAFDLKTQFEMHLPTCANCREQLAQLKELNSLIVSAWQNVELPNNAHFHGSKQTPTAPQSNQPAMAMWAIVSLAAMLLLTIGISQFTRKTATELVESNQPQPPDLASNETKNLLDTIEEILNRKKEYSDSESKVAQSRFQTTYATALFETETSGIRIETNKEFTVYRVMPTITFSKPN